MTAQKGCALDYWQEIADRLTKAPLVALFLDFDGTLTEFCTRPEDVTLDPAMQAVLKALAQSERFRLWIVSGRRHADLRDRVGVSGIHYLGLYGWEARAEKHAREESLQALSGISAWMKALLASAPSVWIEEKQYTVAVHHRAAAADEAELAERVVNFVVGPFSSQFRIIGGKNVWEVVPWEFGDKDSALKQELSRLPHGTVPLYLGDALAETASTSTGGITVHVGEDLSSKTHYRLDDVSQVHKFLSKLHTEIS